MSKRHDFLVVAKRVALDSVPDYEGAYLFASDESATYAGQASSISRRMAEHRWASHIPALKALIMDESAQKALFVFDQEACERVTGLAGRAARQAVESTLVLEIRPSLNERKFSAAHARMQLDCRVLFSGSACAIMVWSERIANRGMV